MPMSGTSPRATGTGGRGRARAVDDLVGEAAGCNLGRSRRGLRSEMFSPGRDGAVGPAVRHPTGGGAKGELHDQDPARGSAATSH